MHGSHPYAIKNQRKARKPLALVGGFGCLELVLYGIRELAKHHYELLENDLHIEWTTLIPGDLSPVFIGNIFNQITRNEIL